MIHDAGEEAKTSDLVNAKTTIDNFVKEISPADFATTYHLQKDLISALGNVTYLLACHIEQLGMLNYMTYNCKAGYDSLHVIYAQAQTLYPRLESEQCHDKVGTPYMTEAEVYKAVEITA